MNLSFIIVLMFWSWLTWIVISFVAFFFWENKKILEKKNKWDNLLEEARQESANILSEAKKEADSIIQKSYKLEEKILEREEKIVSKIEEIEKKKELLFNEESSLKLIKEDINKIKLDLEGKLSELSKLSEEEARNIFLEKISLKYENDWLNLINKYKKKVEDNKKDIAREIILKSMQQYADDVTSEVSTTIIPIPSDDIKWKLIWKEWRNISSFERATWVALIIDDTPDTIFISAFDLYRRYIAKKALEKLIEDWRIQPARIEEIVSSTQHDAELLLKELANKILEELNISSWIPEELIPIIWKLRFRTSYWQNILKHSKETALIAERIAYDLGLDPNLLKIWWLLHDLWKALDQDLEWTHPELWARVWRKYWLKEEIIDMIENHHWEQSSISINAAIIQIADAISSVRPWARREAIEQYVKRVQEMEALVSSFSWVTKAYAISAWKEIRILVDANTVSDFKAQEMARNIANEIQDKLQYPWEVKVSLIREMRVIEYAK